MSTPRHLRLSSFLGMVVVASLAPGRTVAEEAATPPHTHVLYMGTDLMVRHEDKLYRVEDVTGSAFRIKVDGKDVFVPTQRRAVDLHVDAELKLSGLSVELDDLKAAEGYTYGNNPLRKLEEANRNQMATADRQDYAVAGIDHANANLVAIKQMAANGGFGTKERADHEIANAEAQVKDSEHYSDYSTISASSDSSNIGSGALRMAEAKGNYDAMEVSFKVSSPVELSQPYMVILYRFHDPSAKPNVNGLVIHAEALDPIDAKPRYVHVLRGGLPTGFKMVDCTIHIYDHGREVATNASDKRVELKRDEAQLYLMTTYRAAHKGATLPAAAVPGTLSFARRESLSPSQLTRNFFTKVNRDGAVLGIFKDADCKVPLEDPGIKGALDEVFFTPALEAGQAVEGVAKVRFTDI